MITPSDPNFWKYLFHLILCTSQRMWMRKMVAKQATNSFPVTPGLWPGHSGCYSASRSSKNWPSSLSWSLIAIWPTIKKCSSSDHLLFAILINWNERNSFKCVLFVGWLSPACINVSKHVPGLKLNECQTVLLQTAIRCRIVAKWLEGKIVGWKNCHPGFSGGGWASKTVQWVCLSTFR